MTNLRSLSSLFKAAMKLAAACAFATAIATGASAQTNTFPENGNAGIGTTTPAYPLTVNQTGNSINRVVSLANDSSGSSAQSAISFFEGAIEKFKFGLNGSGATGYVGGANAFQLWHFQNAPIVFGTNSVERMRIDGGGNVGIGTTTPKGIFQVGDRTLFGQINTVAPTYSIFSNNAYYSSGWKYVNSDYAGLLMVKEDFVFYNAPSGTADAAMSPTERMRIKNNGNVGIGTGTPTNARLHLFSGASGATEYTAGGYPELTLESGLNTDLYFLSPNTGSARIWFGSPSSNVAGGIMYFHNATPANGYMYFATGNNVERMRILGNGNIGIGTTAPASKLEVAGTIHSTTGGIKFPDGTVQTTAASGGGGGSVISVFGRDGVVTAATNDYTWAQINKTTSSLADLTTRSASDLSSGTVPTARLGSGTANNTTFLRGDSTWAAITSSQWANGSGNINYTAGNVGIGTATTGSKLSVLADDSTSNNVTELLRLSHITTGTAANGIGSRIAFTAERASGIEVYTGYIDSILTDATNVDSALLFHTRDNGGSVTERVRIDSVGNVGIGTPAPASKLEVAGTIHSTTGGFKFPDGSVQTTAGGGGGVGTITGVTAGSGLTGGGTTGSVTLNVGAGTGITVAADTVSVNYGSAGGTAVEGSKQVTITTDGSSGLSGGSTVTLGSGGNFTLANTDKGSTQSIFKNIANAAGTTQFSATSNTDALRFEGTGGTTVSFTGATKKVTIDSSGITSSQWANGSGNINYTAGNVGIGTSSPASGYKLDVNGNTNVTGNLNVTGNINAKYQDLAEWVPSSEQLSAGTVVVLDTTKSNQVVSATVAYDTRVAGVISAQPGITLGEGGAGKVLVATTGRVRVKVDASRGAIQIGDLLVTSDVLGVAMKSEAVNLGGVQIHRPGTIIGKALEPLAKGSGEILVLLSLQ